MKAVLYSFCVLMTVAYFGMIYLTGKVNENRTPRIHSHCKGHWHQTENGFVWQECK